MTRRRFPVGKTLLYVFMSLWALTTIYPFIWVILNSFKPRGLIRSCLLYTSPSPRDCS